MAIIMVVDDEEDIRLSMRNILEAKGYQVHLATNGDECLESVKRVNPDLILMDVLMPGTPVHELLPSLKGYKIIIFSVITLSEKYIPETGKKFPQVGEFPNVVDYIYKPFELEELLAKIKNALAQ